MLLCCLWRNVETSCHKHFAVLSRHQQTPQFTTSELLHTEGVDNTWPVAALTARTEARHWLRIAISAYPTLHSTPSCYGGSRRNIVMPFGMEKLEWCGYPVVKKF